MRRRFAFCLLFFLLLGSAGATTTVTGTMQSLGGSNVTGGFVRFWLRGCAGNQPRVSGSGLIAPTLGGVYYFDFAANGSGVLAGTLYSNRDATGLLGGELECGGSTTATWYGMQAFFGGKGGPEVAVYAKNGSTLDISSVTPITTNPVIAAPTGDSSYLRLDAGNSPVTGAATFSGTMTAPRPGIFTGTSTLYNFFAGVNGTAAWTPQGPGSQEGLVGAVTVPSSATIHQANAVAGYVTNSSTGMGGGGAVAGYFNALALVNNAHVWGINPLCSVNTGLTPNSAFCVSGEFDVNNNTGTDWTGPSGFLNGIMVISGGANKSATGLTISSSNNATNAFVNAAQLLNYSNLGLQIGGPSPAITPGARALLMYGSDALGTTLAMQVLSNLGANLFSVSDTGSVVAGLQLLAPAFISTNGTTASTGAVRLASTDTECWNSNAGGVNFCLAKDTSDRLTFNSQIVSDGAHANTLTIGSGTATSAGTIINAGTAQTLAVTVTGATVTDVATCATNAAYPATWQTGIQVLPPVVTSNTVTLTFTNPTAGNITPVAQTFRCSLMR